MAEAEIDQIKDDSKIEREKNIAAVLAKLGQIDTFPTPLLSGCGLPLKIYQPKKVLVFDHPDFTVMLADTMLLTAQTAIDAGTWVNDAVQGRPHTTPPPA